MKATFQNTTHRYLVYLDYKAFILRLCAEKGWHVEYLLMSFPQWVKQTEGTHA